MKTDNSKMAAMVAFAMAASVSSFAGVTRTVSPTDGGAVIEYSWDAVTGIESSLLIYESLPAGAALSVSPESAVVPKAVRASGTGWSFLLSRADARKAGRFSCVVTYGAGGTAVGGWTGLSSSGARLEGAVEGSSTLPDPSGSSSHSGDGPSSGSGDPVSGTLLGAQGEDPTPVLSVGDFSDFSITAFSVESASVGSTVRFSWTGAGTNAVEIQYCPLLPAAGGAVREESSSGTPEGSASVRSVASMASASVSEEWVALKTVDPSSTYGVVAEPAFSSDIQSSESAEGGAFVKAAGGTRAASSAGGSGLSDMIYSYAIRTGAPSGFFRLVVKLPDAASVE